MSTNTHLAEEGLSEEAVEAWLRAHPDFFERHLALLDVLKLPHQSGGAISLIERQIGWLRDKNRQLERKLLDLVHLARENERLSQRMHHLALGLMDADSLDAVLATIQEQLRTEFRADHVVVRLVGNPADGLHFTEQTDPSLQPFDELFETRRPVCGRLPDEQLGVLFPEAENPVQSAVAVPLMDGSRRLGILALGSREDTRFHPGMGTLFLGYLGEIISHAVATRLKA
jgi:uncharacterized protein YigA (DUF484 family)